MCECVCEKTGTIFGDGLHNEGEGREGSEGREGENKKQRKKMEHKERVYNSSCCRTTFFPYFYSLERTPPLAVLLLGMLSLRST